MGLRTAAFRSWEQEALGTEAQIYVEAHRSWGSENQLLNCETKKLAEEENNT